MKSDETPFLLENMDEFVDPDFFTIEDQQHLVKFAWASFLKRKKEREMPPPSPEELKRQFYSLSE